MYTHWSGKKSLSGKVPKAEVKERSGVTHSNAEGAIGMESNARRIQKRRV